MNDAVPPVAAAATTPPRIKSLTLCDFRAFAGPEPVTFNLDGRNLLIYGENGAGKSSVFHALELEATTRISTRPRDHRFIVYAQLHFRHESATVGRGPRRRPGRPSSRLRFPGRESTRPHQQGLTKTGGRT